MYLVYIIKQIHNLFNNETIKLIFVYNNGLIEWYLCLSNKNR